MRKYLVPWIVLGLVAPAAAGEWKRWESFDQLDWRAAKEGPLTKNSLIVHDDTHVLTGKKALSLEVDCIGWGGAVQTYGSIKLSPPRQGMSVSIYCEPREGSQGVPKAKLNLVVNKQERIESKAPVTLKAGWPLSSPFNPSLKSSRSSTSNLVFTGPLPSRW